MSNQDQYQRELDVIEEVKDKGSLGKFFGYAKISGPGWLQGAITLGGGSLGGALFLGSTSGYGAMWIQPLAMICGVIMLSAIAYVTLSTGQRPFHSINRHLNPLLGWSWIIGTIMANLVWTMPQFSLATEAIQENLGILKGDSGQTIIIVILFLTGLFINHLYQAGGGGAKAFDRVIKIMVAVIVLSFFAVVIALLSSGQLPVAKILGGYFPNPLALFKPVDTYSALIADSNFSDFWKEKISGQQRDVAFAAFASAVGINMTFLLPYTLLRKRWGKKHRGLSITDLSIGLFIPFFLATSCVMIASVSAFHGKAPILEGEALTAAISALEAKVPDSAGMLTSADVQLDHMIQKRGAGSLAVTLEPFTTTAIAQTIFGIGVLGMAVSTIIILMLINGLAFQELFSKDPGVTTSSSEPNINNNKFLYYLGCCLSGLSGCLFPVFWTAQSKAALVIPTSVIGGSLIPIAYITFLLMMNSKKILGEHRPEGKARLVWNTLMIFATAVATSGSIWVLKGKATAGGWFTSWKGMIPSIGLIFIIVLVIVSILSFLKNEKKA